MSEVVCVKSKELFLVIKEILNQGGKARITVTGMSMYPFLRQYIDSVELSPTCFNSIRRGDIVMINRDSGYYVMHRVLKKENNHFYIVGDAQQWIEGPLRPDQLVAIITTVWRGNKLISCSKVWWQLLSCIWIYLLPVRYMIMNTYSKLRQLI
jgi:signal peptidase I